MPKIQVYHFHNSNEGGVLSVIKNLLEFSDNVQIENHLIHTVNKDRVKNYPIMNLKGAASEKVFYYSASWNFYYTCIQLSKLLPDEKAVIATHDWLELGMASNLGLKNPVVTFLHGDYDYYYHLAKLHQASIDKFIVVANDIMVKLRDLLPSRQNDIYYLRFPVPAIEQTGKKKELSNIIFIGRLTEQKGYPLLPVIDKLLRERNVFLNWHVVGEDSGGSESVAWDKNSSVRLYGKMDNAEILLMLQQMNYFILPTLNEGMPVSMVEAMKAGVIPLVNDIGGGIQELIANGVTGYKINNNDPVQYADCIIKLIEDSCLSQDIRNHCIETATRMFDPVQNTRQVENEICKTFLSPLKDKKAVRTYGSRLDQKWLPNIITKSVRNFN